ncbi:alkaline phosphatase [Hymenobacter cellulosilyticus]|uniref:alkaline phosphatase n=1 Tax=Hymenobacter cellulosilyticus TaxID=2932248 RepID=UPI0021D44AC1|nr:alkaline phosphatase [Hymenobacter cellulosilyticus]
MQQAQVTGLSITANQYGKITDSAASATAMATGHKTYNGAIGMDSLGHSFRSIMWDARAQGKSTGLVVACELPDATPACFAVNHPNRQDLEVIARKFLDAPIDFMYGGGLKFFTQRKDQVDLLAQWRAKGYQVATTPQQARALTSPGPWPCWPTMARPGCPPERQPTWSWVSTKPWSCWVKTRRAFF